MIWHKGRFTITDEFLAVDMFSVHRLLACTHWAKNRPNIKTEISLANSLCFSVKEEGMQIGFARVISDQGCCSVVLDVVIHPEYRGQGIGGWLMEVISTHPSILGTCVVLWTTDKVEFYQSCGFTHEERFQFMRIAPSSKNTETQTPNRRTKRYSE